MGLLVEGQPLPPEELKTKLRYIREHGVKQFLITWKRLKDLSNDELKFGDEIECGIFAVDAEAKTVKLSVRGAEIRKQLAEKEKLYVHETEGCTWHPEFGAWMVESTPSRPYTGYATDLLRIERNMLLRRRRILASLQENEIAPTVTCFPLMGTQDFIHNPLPFEAPASQSIFVPDYVINPHPRFAALTRNIRARRGEKVDIRIPLFEDTQTMEYQQMKRLSSSTTAGDNTTTATTTATASLLEPYGCHDNPSKPAIYMDCMAFGMGMCCLQVTFQARDVDESRYMYDQLAVLAPIMMAMTAASPFYKGRIADIDCRWTVIAQSVDDRTPVERGKITNSEEILASRDALLAGEGIKRLLKSRYDSISTYIYHCQDDPDCRRTFAEYNDISCPMEEEYYEYLRAEGVDENLAHHVAHLFSRDPIVAYHGLIESLNDEETTDHFESIQSTNWQTCRWKPPPPQHDPVNDPHIGWRTEFRSMEVQLTDFENAAFTVLIVLLTRVMLAFDVGFYLPLSKVDINMVRAHQRNAVNKEKFYFRRHIAPPPLTDSNGSSNHGEATATAGGAAGTSAASGGGVITSNGLLDSSGSRSRSLSQQANGGFVAHATATATATASANNTPSKAATGSASSPAAAGGDSGNPCGCGAAAAKDPNLREEDQYEEMTMKEIFLGKDDYYPGLLPLIYAYLDFINCDSTTMDRVTQYLQFIEKRASGELMTPATWMRLVVTSHPDYRQDSVITPSIAHDLLVRCHQIGIGAIPCPELFGSEVKIERVRREDAYGQVLAGRLSSQERSALIDNLVRRAKSPRPTDMARGKSRTQSF